MSNMLLNRLTVLFSVIAFILPKCTFLKITPGLLSPSSISLFHFLIYCCFKSCAQQLQYLESLVCFSYYLSCFLFIISQFFVWVGIWSSTMWRSNLKLWMLSSSSIQDLHLLWSGRQVHPGHLNTRSGISESSERSCSGTETNGFPVFLGGALLGPSLTHEEVTWVLATRGTWSLTPPPVPCVVITGSALPPASQLNPPEPTGLLWAKQAPCFPSVPSSCCCCFCLLCYSQGLKTLNYLLPMYLSFFCWDSGSWDPSLLWVGVEELTNWWSGNSSHLWVPLVLTPISWI